MDGINTLAFSGWAQPHDALQSLLPHAQFVDYAPYSSVYAIKEILPQLDVDLVVGWSLGGIIARQLIQRGVLQAKALVMIAAPYQYVRDETVQDAMPQETFEQFYANYRDDTQRTIKRFHGLLVKGDSRMRDILGALGHHPSVEQVERWLLWMDFLQRYSAEHEDYSMLPPTLLIHGKQDVVVPYAQSEMMHQKLSQSQLMGLEDAAHVPHLHDTKRVKDAIAAFYQEVAQ